MMFIFKALSKLVKYYCVRCQENAIIILSRRKKNLDFVVDPNGRHLGFLREGLGAGVRAFQSKH